MASMKVMSFNLRVEAAVDGINHLDNRRGRILNVIANEAPDLIGFQEASDATRAWLRENLSDYTVVGCGRLEDYRGESAPLAFRKDKFEMISMESFWLSSTPSIPASRYEGSDQSSCPRLATAVVLNSLEKGKPILFVNTHMDHKGAAARVMSSAQLIEYMSKKELPCILTGDLNAAPYSEEIRMLCESEKIRLIDATQNIERTFHGFGRLTPEMEINGMANGQPVKIDYVFTSLKTNPSESYAIADNRDGGIYVSDHLPVVAFLEF